MIGNSKQFPIALGGDCSILLENLLALRKLGRYGLFFLNGHPDFCLPENDAEGKLASMDLAIATGRGSDILSNLDGLRPLVQEEDTVVFGYRDGEATERVGEGNIKSTQIYAQNLDAIRQIGVKQAAINALGYCKSRLTGSGFI